MVEDITVRLFHTSICHLNNAIRSLELTADDSQDLRSAIKNKEIICQLPLNREEVRKLNGLIKKVYSAYNTAYEYASHLPATNDCDENAKSDLEQMWKVLL